MFEKIYSLLKRQTSSTHFIPQIDGLRFVAIISVVMLHLNGFIAYKFPYGYDRAPESYSWLFNVGVAGFGGRKAVLLFFVISGFILALPFAKHYWQNGKPIQLKAYFLRRLTRLEPPYIFNMVLVAFLLLHFGGAQYFENIPRSFSGIWPSLASSLTYTHNLLFPPTTSVNPVAWSLEIEVQFYLLVPLLVKILKLPKVKRRTLLVALIFGLTAIQHLFPAAKLSLYSFLQYFLMGFLLVDFYLSGLEIKLKGIYSAIFGLGILITEMNIVDIYQNSYNEYIFIILLFAFCWLVMTNDLWKKIFSLRPLTVIGGMCYTIYLWHDIIISAVGNRLIYLHLPHSYPVVLLVQTLIMLPIVILGSSVFYLLIERPCMDREWPQKLWRTVKFYFKG